MHVALRQTLIGLALAASAFGAAAIMSEAAAPTARADDFTNVIDAVDADYTAGQADLSTAFTDFGGGEFAPGLASLFAGVDDDSIVAPENLGIGTFEVLTNEPIDLTNTFVWTVPADFSAAASYAETLIGYGESQFSTGAADFAAGEYGAGLAVDAVALNAVTIDPLQELLLGAAASF